MCLGCSQRVCVCHNSRCALQVLHGWGRSDTDHLVCFPSHTEQYILRSLAERRRGTVQFCRVHVGSLHLGGGRTDIGGHQMLVEEGRWYTCNRLEVGSGQNTSVSVQVFLCARRRKHGLNSDRDLCQHRGYASPEPKAYAPLARCILYKDGLYVISRQSRVAVELDLSFV